MQLDELTDFLGNGRVPCEVENPQTKQKRTFYIAELDAGTAENLFIGVSKDDQKKNKGLRAKIVAAGVVDAEGKPAFTFEVAQKLPLWLANALQDHILQVNGLTDKTPEEAAEEKKE